jgi:hypothetical protein
MFTATLHLSAFSIFAACCTSSPPLSPPLSLLTPVVRIYVCSSSESNVRNSTPQAPMTNSDHHYSSPPVSRVRSPSCRAHSDQNTAVCPAHSTRLQAAHTSTNTRTQCVTQAQADLHTQLHVQHPGCACARCQSSCASTWSASVLGMTGHGMTWPGMMGLTSHGT